MGSGMVAMNQRVTGHWAEQVSAWLEWLAAGGAPSTTLALRRYQLLRIAADQRAGPWALDAADLAAWLAGHGWAPETLRSYRAALRSFYGWAHASGLIDTDPSRLLRKVHAPIGVPRPAAEPCIDKALANATPRVWLMIMLGSRHGLRRGEISQVHTTDLIDAPDGWTLIVHGKGAKDRLIPLNDDVARSIRHAPPGYLFPGRFEGHMTPAHCGKLVQRALSDATTHQLRHRFASRSYQATRDIRAVQELLGHASVATTQRYTAVASGALRAAVKAAS
jgi:integrase/recombinase XerC